MARSRRGFAGLPVEVAREIQSLGGVAAHAAGVAHEFEKGSEEARRAGRKGGLVTAARRRAEKIRAITATPKDEVE